MEYVLEKFNDYDLSEKEVCRLLEIKRIQLYDLRESKNINIECKQKMKIASIVGNRPQFIKLAPLILAIQEYNKLNLEPEIEHLIIHTGQHYDYEMNKIFFDELDIPEPTYNLGVGSATPGWQTGEMIKRAEEVLIKDNPNWVLVYGDTNSTLAGTIAACKLLIPVAHIEAGLRSYNKEMPEEINRILTDHSSEILFCPTENAVINSKKEGLTNIVNNGKLISNKDFPLFLYSFPHAASRMPLIINVGDIMYDTMIMSLEKGKKKSNILDSLKLIPKSYYLATVHRAENTNNKKILKNIFDALLELSKDKRIVVPTHPRTRKKLESINFSSSQSSLIIDPVSYFDMLVLQKNAKKILTDSGGVQKEAYWLGVPCITLRKETEWVETVEAGWNVIVGTDKKKIIEAVRNRTPITNCISRELLGDGKTASKIICVLMKKFVFDGFFLT